jgi:hypothetical protein
MKKAEQQKYKDDTLLLATELLNTDKITREEYDIMITAIDMIKPRMSMNERFEDWVDDGLPSPGLINLGDMSIIETYGYMIGGMENAHIPKEQIINILNHVREAIQNYDLTEANALYNNCEYWD